jgi:putative ABC transport system permease protein
MRWGDGVGRSASISERSHRAELAVFSAFWLAALVENLFQMPTKLSSRTFAIGGLFSAGIGILFGYYLARKASQLDPIQGLPYE